jgi:hypothetical protein
VADPTQAARLWIKLALPEITTVIDLDQQTADAPRPPGLKLGDPYAGIMLQASRPSGWQTPVELTPETDPPRPIPETYDNLQGWTREGQLLIMLYGPGSQQRAETLQLSLSSPAVLELLDGLEVSVQRPAAEENASAILDTSREPRASLVMTVVWYSEISTPVDVIETVDYQVDVQEG